MSCKNILKLEGCEIAGSTFNGRKFIFPNRDISEDTFTAKVKNFSGVKVAEFVGVKNGSDVYFSFADLESLKVANYTIEYWAEFKDLATEVIALEKFKIENPK